MRFVAYKTSQVLLHMGVAFAVTYAFTGSLAVGGLAAVVEPICNVTLMPLHDRLWARLRMGGKTRANRGEEATAAPLRLAATAN